MKASKLLFVSAVLALLVTSNVRADESVPDRVLLLITEQNIAGPQRAWWASEVDLSTIEAALGDVLLERGYVVVEPGETTQVLKDERAFRILRLSERSAASLGRKVEADYIVRGKAVASQGGIVPQSQLSSFYANVAVRLIRVSDGKLIAALSARGSAAHTDAITGGAEALEKAGKELAIKIGDILDKQGAKK